MKTPFSWIKENGAINFEDIWSFSFRFTLLYSLNVQWLMSPPSLILKILEYDLVIEVDLISHAALTFH